MVENLDALKYGGWGVFIAPTTKMTVGEGLFRMAHRTLSGAPATSPGRWVPTIGAFDNGSTGQSGGPPDRSCSLSGAHLTPALTLRAQSTLFTVHCSVADDRWRLWPLLRLAHRTVLCCTGQSGEL
jgi:hypothetical protein